MGRQSIGTPVIWGGFTVLVLGLLMLDLGVFHRRMREIRFREALLWVCVWVALALSFNVAVYFQFGSERALEFFAGYLIEKALSVDNLFVFIAIFTFLAVPSALQHRALFWGILGALVLRAVFIFVGAAVLQKFYWVRYLLAAFLIFLALKLFVQQEHEVHLERNSLFRLYRRWVPSVESYRDGQFTVVEDGRRYATPLLLVVVTIEATDIVFAADSIPAVFAVAADPFIVYTSNIFAILGLRALYFALAGVIGKFHYLRVGLSLVLAFVGVKMLVAGVVKVPILLSLAVIACLLAGAVLASVLWPLMTPALLVQPPCAQRPAHQKKEDAL